MNILLILIVLIASGIFGMWLDIKKYVDEPPAYWVLGVVTGVLLVIVASLSCTPMKHGGGGKAAQFAVPHVYRPAPVVSFQAMTSGTAFYLCNAFAPVAWREIFRLDWRPAADSCFYPISYQIVRRGASFPKETDHFAGLHVLTFSINGTQTGDAFLAWRSEPYEPPQGMCMKAVRE